MFTVVVPVYNHQEFVTSSLISAGQSPLVTEILVVDDGSADQSGRLVSSLAARHCKISLLSGERSGNFGAPDRLNALVRRARNHWVAVLNSDDEFVPGRFEAIEHSVRRATADLFFGDIIIIDQASERVALRRALIDNEYSWQNEVSAIQMANDGRWTELLLQQNILATTTNMVFSKTIFERVGGFRPYRYCHDWDFAIRVSLCGIMRYAPLLMSRYRIHPGNTIRENRSGVEAEVRRMMAQIQEDYPKIPVDRVLNAAILKNRYVNPLRRTWLEIVRSEEPASGLVETMFMATDMDVRFVDSPVHGAAAGAYTYAPRDGMLSANDLRNIRLAVAVRAYDVYLISRALEPFPDVGSNAAQDLIIYRRGWVPNNSQPSTARLVRLLPVTRPAVPLRELIGDARFLVDHAFADAIDDSRDWPKPLALPDEGLGKRPTRPVVFIFPIFLAMGGAERLVLETIRHLATKYHFVIINTEPLRPENGSVHEEALRHADVYDITETVRGEDRLAAIELLKQHYRPIILWITNGNPWQIAHADVLRKIFADTPIVDNQAYDHERGWINAFANPAVRSSDRFIAINRKIRTVMVERFGIAEEQIDLVYHGANISHLRAELTAPERLPEVRSGLGLPQQGLVFGMVGRLTTQKRPADLVHLASRMAVSGATHHFLWAGPGEMRVEIEELRKELRADNFTLLPARSDIRPIYEAIDGLIITSEFEGLPFVMLEALAMGIPVLSTPVGAIEEVLNTWGCGQISGSPGDIDALVASFSRFVEQLPELRIAARQRRLEFIDRYSSERMAAEYDASWMRAIAARTSIPVPRVT